MNTFYTTTENRRWMLVDDSEQILCLMANLAGRMTSAVIECYNSGYDVVGGAYPKKQDVEEFPIHLLPNQSGRYREAMYLPGGFMFIRRHVFEKMQPTVQKYTEPGFGNETVDCYFQNMVYDGYGRVGEDVEFCNRWRRLGGKVWCLPDIYFEHQGPKAWKGKLSDSLPPLYEVKEQAA